MWHHRTLPPPRPVGNCCAAAHAPRFDDACAARVRLLGGAPSSARPRARGAGVAAAGADAAAAAAPAAAPTAAAAAAASSGGRRLRRRRRRRPRRRRRRRRRRRLRRRRRRRRALAAVGLRAPLRDLAAPGTGLTRRERGRGRRGRAAAARRWRAGRRDDAPCRRAGGARAREHLPHAASLPRPSIGAPRRRRLACDRGGRREGGDRRRRRRDGRGPGGTRMPQKAWSSSGSEPSWRSAPP